MILLSADDSFCIQNVTAASAVGTHKTLPESDKHGLRSRASEGRNDVSDKKAKTRTQ